MKRKSVIDVDRAKGAREAGVHTSHESGTFYPGEIPFMAAQAPPPGWIYKFGTKAKSSLPARKRKRKR